MGGVNSVVPANAVQNNADRQACTSQSAKTKTMSRAYKVLGIHQTVTQNKQGRNGEQPYNQTKTSPCLKRV